MLLRSGPGRECMLGGHIAEALGAPAEEDAEEKSDEYSDKMQERMVRPGHPFEANLAMLGGAGNPRLAGLQGGSLTYRHEDGMNYAHITDGLIVGSCLQTPADLDKCARRARPHCKSKNHLCAVTGS